MDYQRLGSPAFPTPRRVVTAPTTLPSSQRSSQAGVETLFNHPNAKIVSFTAPGRSPSHTPTSPAVGEPGTLSCSSQLERTIAVGAFRIYRAPGSVAFLNCGSALQPILPKSQCWCMEEDSSKFVLQIRRPQFWRIELPVAMPEEQHLAEILKDVFDKILLFEKTECPFKRSFTVKLPEPPPTPIKKRPWTPARRSFAPAPISSPNESIEPITLSPIPKSRTRTKVIDGTSNSVSPGSQATATEVQPHQPSQKEAANEGYGSPDRTSEWPRHPSDEDVPDENIVVGEPKAVHGQTPVESVYETPNQTVRRQEDISEMSPVIEDIENKTPTEERDTLANAPVLPQTLPESKGRSRDPVLPMQAATPTKTVRGSFAKVACLTGEHVQEANMRARETSHVASHLDSKRMTDSQSTQDEVRHNSIVGQENTENDSVEVADEIHEGSGCGGNLPLKKRLRRPGFHASRSVTAPPQLTLIASPPSKSATGVPSLPAPAVMEHTEPVSPTGSQDSFHSVQSWHSPITPLPPSPPTSQTDSTANFPYPHDNITIPKRSTHHRDVSELTVTPDTQRTWDMASATSSEASHESTMTAPDKTPGPTDDSRKLSLSEDCASTTALSRSCIRHRPTTSISTRRALSPLPPAANLFSPSSAPKHRQYRARMETVRRIPFAILSKTCEVLLGPPSHLVSLMLKVAAKIVAGEWRGLVFGFGDGGEKIPVQWDYSDEEYSSWDEDEDYYMPGSGQRRDKHQSTRGDANTGAGEGDGEDGDSESESDPLGTINDEREDYTGRSWEVD